MLFVSFQSFLVSSKVFGKCVNTVRRKRGPKNRYKAIEQELVDNPQWPPLGDVVMATANGLGATVVVRDSVTVPLEAQ